MIRLRIYVLASCVAVAGLARSSAPQQGAEGLPTQKSGQAEDHPFLALWRRDGGHLSPGPYLRFAIWTDGRVLYAKSPEKWGHDLRQGKISTSRVARLKAALADSGVFDLKSTSYLVPDAPEDCLMVDLGDKKQILYWDEVESPDYGIGIDPKPRDLEFKRCWKAINHLGLVALPDQGESIKERIRVPKSWYVDRAEQTK